MKRKCPKPSELDKHERLSATTSCLVCCIGGNRSALSAPKSRSKNPAASVRGISGLGANVAGLTECVTGCGLGTGGCWERAFKFECDADDDEGGRDFGETDFSGALSKLDWQFGI